MNNAKKALGVWLPLLLWCQKFQGIINSKKKKKKFQGVMNSNKLNGVKRTEGVNKRNQEVNLGKFSGQNLGRSSIIRVMTRNYEQIKYVDGWYSLQLLADNCSYTGWGEGKQNEKEQNIIKSKCKERKKKYNGIGYFLTFKHKGFHLFIGSKPVRLHPLPILGAANDSMWNQWLWRD